MEQKNGFKKSLGLWDSTAIVAGSMIGSGIFIVSSDIARQVESAWLLLVVWLVAGVMTVAGALCYGEYAASMPEAGGQYIYLKKVWGELTGFLYGWTLFSVIQTGTIAAVCVAFAKFLGSIVPQVSSDIILLNLGAVTVSSQQLLAILLILLLTFINLKGIKMGAIVQNIFTVTKVAALLGVILCGIFIGLNANCIDLNFSQNIVPSTLSGNVCSLVAIALVGALFSSDAWNNVTFIAAEIKDASKNLPKALLMGTGSVILLYLFTNIAYLGVLSLSQIQQAKGDIVGVAMMDEIFGGTGKYIIAVIILISAFGCANGMTLAGARVYYAMAQDGLFFKKLAELNEKTNVPANALYLQCFWITLLIMSGSYSQLLDYVIFAALLFYILTVGGLFLFRKKFPDMNRPYKTLLYPYLPIFYCLLASFTAVNLLIYKPVYTWSGLGLVLLGIPVYYFWRKGRSVVEEEIVTPEV